MSIESQGYDTLLAEINEKLWKQKTEQFMKRTKSESYRALSLYLSLSLSLCKSSPFACVVGWTPLAPPYRALGSFL